MADMGATDSKLPESDFRAFATGALACISRIVGESSEYYKTIPQDLTNHLHSPGYAVPITKPLIGSLKALRNAVDANLLVSLEDRLRANIHDDFLQQAKSLLDDGYHVAAIVLTGGVLEDHLRKLCEARGLQWTGDGTIAKYNDLLHGKLYEKPTWRRIQTVGDNRNNAAHGKGSTLKPEDVADDHKYVTRFLTDHPS
jgi:hypothetical protein